MTHVLKGKIALVTGASRGIGAAIARRLAAEGVDVAFSYSQSPERAQAVLLDIQAHGVKGLAIAADQSNSAAVTALVEKVHAHFGRLDILVNSAGVFVTGVVGDPLADIAELDRQHAINVGGVVAAVRAAVPLLSEGGRIISIGTMFASRAPFPGIGDYAATKAAVAAYSRAWARDLGSRNITVNTVQPGPINTEMNPETSDVAPMVKQMTALGRYGQPEEIAGVVAFLAGPDAAYITGATLNVDGGQNS
ncbi:short-chain dehydrogenase/reductase SDR [Pseudomonas sp. CFII64]|jgi:3-oxoacyl-[acyl-carrier protein] reductase|uniref:SDR family NAD(P)-dependent oxidoreductase n=1 Tax=Pseudomonas sp. CFII64 TaxID=911242 RepID=UPI0003579864|nr:SDR family oxidoreductase [Pseudomonas sp. CFII64]EPJ80089.1 short-chain dehydrogenase/reductase SDR [Pseudomonas sp. CFII64]